MQLVEGYIGGFPLETKPSLSAEGWKGKPLRKTLTRPSPHFNPNFNWLPRSFPSGGQSHPPPLSPQRQQWLGKYRIEKLFLAVLCLELFMTLGLRPQYLETREGKSSKGAGLICPV